MVELLPGRSRTTKVLLGIAAVLFILNFYVFVANRPIALAVTPVTHEAESTPVTAETPPGQTHRCIRIRTHVAPQVNVDEIRLQTRRIQERLNDLRIDLHTELETLETTVDASHQSVNHITIRRF